ncbi:MAG TPA: malectin domain-containing carbohydrate-binding protein [Chthoniobacteraceae bacterium]|jgi:hypothetical protein|nr:malectin domain-containing carbohydrate-binding protein [Chthoniobacteraceae bacterium]
MRHHLLAIALILSGFIIPARADLNVLPNGTGAPDSVNLDSSWRLWLDPSAPWESDKLYLPDEAADLSRLPQNKPTGGWSVLDNNAGIGVKLPDTVEAHYWNKKPLPVANPANPEDIVRLYGAYKGVSWWYRQITAPSLQPGQRLILHFPGAHLRAEVYVNGHLAGYNIISEIPFDADITDAVKPGPDNQLAVRITNPGGTFSWSDFGTDKWGNYNIPNAKAFGGLSGGVTMTIRGTVAVDDLYIANHPDPRQVTLNIHLASNGPAYKGPLNLYIARLGKIAWSGAVNIDVPAGGTAAASQTVKLTNAELWDIGRPNLYRAIAGIASLSHSTRITEFGFRWFNAEGIGQNPHLELNGRRIFVKSAISWGYWAPNGMFPDANAVDREVAAAHALGMNCIQTHRHFPKAIVLDGFDQAGLLRYCEPGAGQTEWNPPKGQADSVRFDGKVEPSGDHGEPSTFTNRYEFAKIMAMIHAYRSHPCVIMWSMQNEVSNHLNPRMFYLMNKVHEADPSRITVLTSGFGKEGQIMARPYSPELHWGAAATHHESGWDDNHNESSNGVYMDSLYKSPTDFKTYTTDTNGIAMWGELGTAASPDDDTQIVRWYREKGITGYDLDASVARLGAYDRFLDKYHFRSAFPTAEALFHSAVEKHYFAAAHIAEDARIADANDYIALTGWESTTVDNMSGMVDALRLPKADPAIIKQAMAPELLVIRAHHYVLSKGDTAIADAFIVNELNRKGPFNLRFTAAMDADPSHPFYSGTFPADVTGGMVFGQLLKDNITFAPPSAGAATMTAELLPSGSAIPVLRGTEPLYVVDPNPAPLTGSIAYADFDGTLAGALKKHFGVTAIPIAAAPSNVDTIVFSARGARNSTLDTSQPQRTSNTANTTDPGLYTEEAVAKAGDIDWYDNLAPGNATVTLYFAESYFDLPASRVFDLAFNGKTVESRFDIFSAAGGKNRAVEKTFTVACPDGKLFFSIPRVESDQPELAAIRITDRSGKVIREVFRGRDYTSPSGEVWKAANPPGFDWKTMIPRVLDRVRNGARLVVMGGDFRDVQGAARVLNDERVLTYNGLSGFDDIAWLGHWYFGRKHWLLDGLPSNCVLDWQYQAGAPGNGLKIDAPGMEGVIGYGHNPGIGLGFGEVVVPCGKGQIVLIGLGGLYAAFADNDPSGFAPPTATRMIYNALRRE